MAMTLRMQNGAGAVAVRPLNWELTRVTDFSSWSCDQLCIDIRWPSNRYSSSKAEVFVQNTKKECLDSSLEAIEQAAKNSRLITKVRVNIEVSDSETVEAVLEKLTQLNNMRLEQLFIRRRYVGQSFRSLATLIRQHSSTLHVLGKIGLSEALASFGPDLHLSRLSLINFDLIEDGQMESAELTERTRFCWRRLGGLGATFSHLSYTTYSNFQLTKNPFLHTLRLCKVESFRLTMQKGEVFPAPALIHPLLNDLRRLELVGDVEADCEHLSVYFPQLEVFDWQKVDLVCGPLSGLNLSIIQTDPRHSSFTERAFANKHGSVAIGRLG